MTRKETLAMFRRLHSIIRRAADRTSNDRQLDRLEKSIAQEERGHRSFGRRLGCVDRKRASVADAVSYFVVRTVQQGAVSTIEDLVGAREDYVWGALLAQDRRFAEALEAALGAETLPTDWDALDYCEVIVGEKLGGR